MQASLIIFSKSAYRIFMHAVMDKAICSSQRENAPFSSERQDSPQQSRCHGLQAAYLLRD